MLPSKQCFRANNFRLKGLGPGRLQAHMVWGRGLGQYRPRASGEGAKKGIGPSSPRLVLGAMGAYVWPEGIFPPAPVGRAYFRDMLK